MPRKGLQIGVDTSGAETAIGFIQQMTANFKSSRYTSSVLKYTHSTLSREFDRYMSGLAQTNKERYHHVYEWNKTGVEAAQLWRHVLRGSGANRLAEWEWKPSITPIPTPEERAQNRNDPMSAVPDDVIAKLSNRTYKFTWKAQVMEYNNPVTIRPRYARRLFIPTFRTTQNGKHYYMTDTAYNERPGGYQTTGAFTAAWVRYWTEVAPKSFTDEVARVIEKDLGRGEREIGQAARSRRARPKSVGLSAAANNAEAFEVGKRQAQAFMDKLAGEYDRYDYTEDGEW